ncbi:MAG TPA: cation diffusion facilitator family transporter [Haliangiales bacterium]|nr:cation diffusion facilitator family transporter [Haliangiales bacterium]
MDPVQRVIVQILTLNVAVAAAKAAYGWFSGSLSVASDAIHSTLDAAANVIGIVFLRMAKAPPDREHPYGHHKIETLAAAFIGLLIAGGAVRFAVSAVEALARGREPPVAGAGGFAVMLGTLAVNIAVTRYEHRRGRELGSAFLVADAAHTLSDVFVTVGVIGALVASRLGVGAADPLVALAVIAVIAHTAWRIVTANLSVLLDRAVVDPERIRAAAMAVEGVAGCHRVRSRGVEGALLIDCHIQVDGALPLRDAHALSHRVEASIRGALAGVADVTIHIEPEGDPEDPL